MVSEALDVTQLSPGAVLMEKYRVVRTLGVGGMGVVVACDHLQLDTRVAIKFLLPNLLSNKSVVQRFMQEAKAATRIQSTHVAKVIDVGRFTHPGLPDEGLPYMVMEYLEGRDLSEWVRIGKKFSVGDAIDYTLQACEALAQAHKQGIIHRDIKPANLFLADPAPDDDGGRPVIKVLDFGISKIMDEEPQEMGLTKTTTVLGSGLYMSPEQMRSAKSVDFRSDIYSLGVCLYELLSGTQPHTAETFSELCVKVNIDPPTPLSDYRPDISDDLADVIAKAYEKDPEDRYQSVQEMAEALAPFARDESARVAQRIQGITRHASIPPTSGVAKTAAGVTAQRIEPKPKSGAGMVITAAVITLAMAAAVAGFLIRTRSPGDDPVLSGTPEPALSDTTTATTSTATTTASTATTTASTASTTRSTASVAPPAPVPVAPKSVAPKTGPKPAPPPPPPPPPPPCQPKKDPDTGMLIPCL